MAALADLGWRNQRKYLRKASWYLARRLAAAEKLACAKANLVNKYKLKRPRRHRIGRPGMTNSGLYGGKSTAA